MPTPSKKPPQHDQNCLAARFYEENLLLEIFENWRISRDLADKLGSKNHWALFENGLSQKFDDVLFLLIM